MSARIKQFSKNLRSCNKNMQCRLEVIDKMGFLGIHSIISELRFAREPIGKGPTLGQIEKAIRYVKKTIGLFAGQAFRQKSTGFFLVYKGHFEVLKVADESIKKYWGHFEFLSWVMDIIGELDEKTAYFCREIGHFERNNYFPTMSYPGNRGNDESSERLQRVKKIILRLDACLLEDMGQVYALILDGLDKIMKIPLPKNNFDLVAYKRTERKVMALFLESHHKITRAPKRVIRHWDSWSEQNGKFSGKVKFKETLVLSNRVSKSLEMVLKKMENQ